MGMNADTTTMLLTAGSCEIRAGSDVTKTPTVEILAYSGALMRVPKFGTAAIDLEGLELPDQIPLLADHDFKLSGVVGFGTASNRGGKLTASGIIQPTTEAAQHILDLARGGLRFGASVGVEVTDRQFIEPGETARVNGVDIVAPDQGFTLVRAGKLREISITALAADSSTSVTIAASLTNEKGQLMSDANENATKTITAEALAETNRIIGIKAACGGEYLDLQAKGISEGWDAERAEVEVFRASMDKGPNLKMNSGRSDLSSDTLEASLLLRAGAESVAIAAFGEKTVQQADDLRIDSMPDLCKASLRLAGLEEPRGRDAMLKAAFSTTSLPGILSNASNKVLAEAYQTFPSVAKQIAKKLTANDFKSHTGYRLTGDAVLKQLAPTGEIRHGQLDESSYPYSINTYARMFGITRTDIINDDLSAFDEVPKIIARGSSLVIEQTFWTLVLANTGSFFASGNNNYIEGADTALDSDSLAEGVETMRKLVDGEGDPIAVEPKWLVVPPELEAVADGLFASLNLVVAGDTDIKLPATNVQGGKYQPLVSPYLSNSNYPGYSATAWYLFGLAADVASFGIAYLDNIEVPTIETQASAFNTLGVEMRGYIDFGVTQIDSNGGIKSKGAA